MKQTKSKIKDCFFAVKGEELLITPADDGDGVYINACSTAFIPVKMYDLSQDLEDAVRDYLINPESIEGLESVLKQIDAYNLARYSQFAGRTLAADGLSVDFLFPEDSPILEVE